jgi:hypothetical protein
MEDSELETIVNDTIIATGLDIDDDDDDLEHHEPFNRGTRHVVR